MEFGSDLTTKSPHVLPTFYVVLIMATQKKTSNVETCSAAPEIWFQAFCGTEHIRLVVTQALCLISRIQKLCTA